MEILFVIMVSLMITTIILTIAAVVFKSNFLGTLSAICLIVLWLTSAQYDVERNKQFMEKAYISVPR